MKKAKKAKDQPDQELQEIIADLPRISASSKSTARHDVSFDDGSRLVVTSRNGEAVEQVVVEDDGPTPEVAAPVEADPTLPKK